MKQREIKFRAWDGKQMYPSRMYDGLDVFFSWMKDRAKAYMQYTGLKDANGVEIYEGDIVVENGMGDPLLVSFNDENYGGVWGWNLLDANGNAETYYYGESPSEFHSVIGNIYENPELLKAEGEG